MEDKDKDKLGGTYECKICKGLHLRGQSCDKKLFPSQIFKDVVDNADFFFDSINMSIKTREAVKFLFGRLRENINNFPVDKLQVIVRLGDMARVDFQMNRLQEEEALKILASLEAKANFLKKE